MAGYFKKRKSRQGPNKNEQKVLRAENAADRGRIAGALNSRFPSVKRLSLHLTFLDAHQHELDKKTLSLSPSDAALFTQPCPGLCGRGTFDFAGKIAESVNSGQALSESSLQCTEVLYAGSPKACGCQVRFRLEMDFFPAVEAK